MAANAPLTQVKIALLQRGLTQKRLAALIGYKAGYLRAVICGTAKSPKARKAIERELGISVWPVKTNETHHKET